MCLSLRRPLWLYKSNSIYHTGYSLNFFLIKWSQQTKSTVFYAFLFVYGTNIKQIIWLLNRNLRTVENKENKTHWKIVKFWFCPLKEIFVLRKLYGRTDMFEEGVIFKKKILSCEVCRSIKLKKLRYFFCQSLHYIACKFSF